MNISWVIVIICLAVIICLSCICIIKERELTDALTNRLDPINSIEYSNKMLDFLKRISMEQSVIKYKEFIDNHELSKITKHQIQSLVSEIAIEIDNSLVYEYIDYDNLLYSRDYVETYVINVVSMSIKDQLDKSMSEY